MCEIQRREEEIRLRRAEAFRWLAKHDRHILIEDRITRLVNAVTLETKVRELIGKLWFISLFTRPDIKYAINYLSRFLNFPTKEVLNASKYPENDEPKKAAAVAFF